MVDLLDEGLQWLGDQMQQFASQPVLYVRGENSLPVTATIGRTEFETVDAHGVLQRLVSRDYLIPVNALTTLNGTTRPERGDEVHEVRDGRLTRYQVIAPSGEPHWRYSDAYQRMLRIHTKLLDEETIA